MNLRLSVSMLFLSAAFAPQIAAAQYGLSSTSNSNASGGFFGDPQSDSHSGLTGPVSSQTNSRAIYSPSSSHSEGSAYGLANYGKLHAETSGDGGGNGGNGNNTSRWFDTLTVTSSNLAFGSPVTLTATAHYTGSFSAYIEDAVTGSSTGLDGRSSVIFQSDIGNTPLSYSASLDLYSLDINRESKTLPIDYTIQQNILTSVGATLMLDSGINISSSGYGYGPKSYGSGSGSVDSVFDVQSQTAGVTLLRASAAVPEPSAFVTVLFGMGMLGIVSRFRRT